MHICSWTIFVYSLLPIELMKSKDYVQLMQANLMQENWSAIVLENELGSTCTKGYTLKLKMSVENRPLRTTMICKLLIRVGHEPDQYSLLHYATAACYCIQCYMTLLVWSGNSVTVSPPRSFLPATLHQADTPEFGFLLAGPPWLVPTSPIFRSLHLMHPRETVRFQVQYWALYSGTLDVGW